MQHMQLNEERAKVVALHADYAELAARDASTCGRCAARTGCGHGLLDTLGRGRYRTFVVPRSALPTAVTVGEELLVGVPEGAIVRAATLVYGLPLAGLVAGAVLASGNDAAALLAACLGFVLGFLLARGLARGLESSRSDIALRCRRPDAIRVDMIPANAEPRAQSVV